MGCGAVPVVPVGCGACLIVFVSVGHMACLHARAGGADRWPLAAGQGPLTPEAALAVSCQLANWSMAAQFMSAQRTRVHTGGYGAPWQDSEGEWHFSAFTPQKGGSDQVTLNGVSRTATSVGGARKVIISRSGPAGPEGKQEAMEWLARWQLEGQPDEFEGEPVEVVEVPVGHVGRRGMAWRLREKVDAYLSVQ